MVWRFTDQIRNKIENWKLVRTYLRRYNNRLSISTTNSTNVRQAKSTASQIALCQFVVFGSLDQSVQFDSDLEDAKVLNVLNVRNDETVGSIGGKTNIVRSLMKEI